MHFLLAPGRMPLASRQYVYSELKFGVCFFRAFRMRVSIRPTVNGCSACVTGVSMSDQRQQQAASQGPPAARRWSVIHGAHPVSTHAKHKQPYDGKGEKCKPPCEAKSSPTGRQPAARFGGAWRAHGCSASMAPRSCARTTAAPCTTRSHGGTSNLRGPCLRRQYRSRVHGCRCVFVTRAVVGGRQ